VVMRSAIDWFRIRLILWLWPSRSDFMSCANRRQYRVTFGRFEITMLLRDISQPDGYERTELLQMLQTVRRHEAYMGWKVPE
jgi:hypothetical protein